MNWAIVTAKVDPKIKKEAQKTAREAGVPLSSIIKASLKDFVRTKTVTFGGDGEKPSKYLLKAMKKAEEDYKKGNTSPVFKTGEETVAWLKKQGI